MPRTVPSALLAHFATEFHSSAHCWAIKPKYGPWEGYTSLDRNLALDAFDDTPSGVPELVYLCAGGVSTTTIPTRLNLSKSGVDVSVLAFDREKLLQGYYRDALFEAFVINYEDTSMDRDVVVSGRIGNIEVGPVMATVELVPWNARAEISIGRMLKTFCSARKFGCGACRNLTLNDGPLRADHSADAVIVSATNARQFRVSYIATSRSGGALPELFSVRLVEGDVEFKTDASGGRNAGNERGIKSAVAVAGMTRTFDLTLHEELPFVPVAGDDLWLVSGCMRDEAACKQIGNIKNFQGVPDRVTQAAMAGRAEE
jgi:uncharacterized phage protein (TIGR02218 family)